MRKQKNFILLSYQNIQNIDFFSKLKHTSSKKKVRNNTNLKMKRWSQRYHERLCSESVSTKKMIRHYKWKAVTKFFWQHTSFFNKKNYKNPESPSNLSHLITFLQLRFLIEFLFSNIRLSFPCGLNGLNRIKSIKIHISRYIVLLTSIH